MRKFQKNSIVLISAVFFLQTQTVYAGPGWPAVYDPRTVLNLNLDMSTSDWNTISNDTTFEIEVPAMFWADGEEPMLISVRRKSATAVGGKISLKLDINEYLDQQWNNLKKLSLENGDDEDVVAEGFAWYLHRLASQDADSSYQPGLASWVTLYVNGEYQGVYVNVEQPDKQFLKNRGLYSKHETWLYKAGDVSTVELKVGDADSPTTGILCYSPFVTGSRGHTKAEDSKCPAAESDEAMAAELEKLIDMKSMLTQAAVEAFVRNPDALFSHGKNFYYIDFISNGKLIYLPWDYDASFVSNKTDASIYATKKGGRLSQSAYQQLILNNAEFRSQYNNIMAGLLNGALQIDTQIAFLNKLEILLASPLEADINNNLEGTVSERFDALRQWVGRRVISINNQLGN